MKWGINMKNKFIIIEGIDNVGKTSTAKKITQRLNTNGLKASYHKTPNPRFAEATKIINIESSTDAHYLYHTSMVKFSEDKIRLLLQKEWIICDRWFYSTYAYHRAANSNINIDISSLMAIPPDHKFLLIVNDEKERIKRGIKKGKQAETHDLKTKDEEPILEKAESILLSFDFIVVDTTNISLEKVVDIIYQKIIR